MSGANESRDQLARFLVVGGLTVLVDLAVYWLLLWLGATVAPAKTAGFIAGTLFSYVANRAITFRAQGGAGVALRFIAVYLTTLLVNVGANTATVAVMGHDQIGLAMAFLLATAISATLNFIGMKYLVFSHRPAAS
ncbi:MAG: GtrA family protein [Phreatobacter sp.]